MDAPQHKPLQDKLLGRRGPLKKQSTALYKLGQLALRLSEHQDEYALFQSDPTVPATKSGTEQAVLLWR